MTVLLWVANLGYAASDGASTPPAATTTQGQGFLLIGTGCYLLPLLAALLFWR